jgi:hypothetical protein
MAQLTLDFRAYERRVPTQHDLTKPLIYSTTKDLLPEVEFPGDLKTLISTGIWIDVVDGLYFAKATIGETFPLVKSISELSSGSKDNSPGLLYLDAPTGNLDTKDMIWHSMIFGRYQDQRPPASFRRAFENLFFSAIHGILMPTCSIHSWLEENRSFLVGGRPLLEWFDCNEKPSSAPSYLVSGSTTRTFVILAAEKMFYCGKRLLTTQKGRISMAPHKAQKEDKICVLFSCGLPVVLRDHGHYHELIGECYLHRQMDGEVIEEYNQGKWKAERFVLR